MNQEILRRWLSALRSGEYKQTQDVLHDKDGFCCLGVLCDIYLKDHSENWIPRISDPNSYIIDSSYGILSPNVRKWAGLYSANPTIKDVEGRPDERLTLSEINDVLKLSFAKIATLIEKEFAE